MPAPRHRSRVTRRKCCAAIAACRRPNPWLRCPAGRDRLKTHGGYIACNYSFYTTDSKKIITNYEVPYNHDVVLAFPAHKASVLGHLTISKEINLYSAVVFKGPRYGIVEYNDESGETIYQKFEPIYIFNLIL